MTAAKLTHTMSARPRLGTQAQSLFVPTCGKFPTSVRSELIENAAQPCHLEQGDTLSHDMGPSLPVLVCRCPAVAKSTVEVLMSSLGTVILQSWHVIVSFYV